MKRPLNIMPSRM